MTPPPPPNSHKRSFFMKQLKAKADVALPPIVSIQVYDERYEKICQNAEKEIERINKRLSMIGPSDERKRLEADKGGYEFNILLYC